MAALVSQPPLNTSPALVSLGSGTPLAVPISRRQAVAHKASLKATASSDAPLRLAAKDTALRRRKRARQWLSRFVGGPQPLGKAQCRELPPPLGWAVRPASGRPAHGSRSSEKEKCGAWLHALHDIQARCPAGSLRERSGRRRVTGGSVVEARKDRIQNAHESLGRIVNTNCCQCRACLRASLLAKPARVRQYRLPRARAGAFHEPAP